MNHGIIRTIGVFALFGILVLTLTLYASPATAQEKDGGQEDAATPIDMETDEDGNGIPDDFETEFRELLGTMLAMDSASLKMGDIYEGEAYKTLRDFYERLPIEAATKEVLDELPGLYQKLILDDELEKNPKALDEIVAKEKEVAKNDEVYARVVRYIEAITSNVGESESGITSQSGEAPSVFGQTREYYETRINQVGDIILRDTRGDPGIKESFSHEYAMSWTHTGVYADNGLAYDADASGGAGCTGAGSGVALRSLNRYFQDGYWIGYSQLETVAGQESEEGAYLAAVEDYDTDCSTAFNIRSDKNSTDSFYCSKLTWRIYQDNPTHPTNVDSNHPTYFAWLYAKYWVGAYYIILYWVAPDEIALDWDLDHYYTSRVVLSE